MPNRKEKHIIIVKFSSKNKERRLSEKSFFIISAISNLFFIISMAWFLKTFHSLLKVLESEHAQTLFKPFRWRILDKQFLHAFNNFSFFWRYNNFIWNYFFVGFFLLFFLFLLFITFNVSYRHKWHKILTAPIMFNLFSLQSICVKDD